MAGNFNLPGLGLPKESISDIVKTGIGKGGDSTIADSGKLIGEMPIFDINAPVIETLPHVINSGDPDFNPVAQNDPELDRIYEKLDEIRTEEWGPKFEDLSKADMADIDREIEKMKEEGTYGSEENVVEDPNMPGVSYQQVGEFVETTVTLYDGLAFNELPEQDQLDVLEYEQNKKDIENSSLSDREKQAAIAGLDLPECMENISEEKRYQKGKVEDIVGPDAMPQEDESPVVPANDDVPTEVTPDDDGTVVSGETFSGPGYSGVITTVKATEEEAQRNLEEWQRQQEELQRQYNGY